MNATEQKLGQNIFLESLNFDESKRTQYITEKCKGNTQLLDYVLSLLTASLSSDNYFDALEESITSSQLNEIEDYHFRDNDFGNYKIIKALKQGGMGTIFLAQRSDGEFERQVIIKMIPIDLNFAHSQSQFAHEKEILASLIHPNIVQLYDSGITKAGQSYFVMELVNGKTLISHCNDKQLNIKQRLALFHEVLLAVGYAHQHLVIHGDIKPSNIMVNDDGQVKLLDFGIAKLVDTTEAVFEGYSLNYLTPEHKNRLPIITTTDIHQLGQLLLELLINISPKNTRQDDFVFTKISSIYSKLKTEEVRKLSSNTQSSKNLLSKFFNSDLQDIIVKALEKNPTLRYKAIQAFDDDLTRYKQGYCVSAKVHTLYYRITKYVKRNLILTASIASLLLLSSIFTFVTIQNNKKLSIERDKALAVKNLITDVFTAADPSFMPGKELTATEVLDNGLNKVREKFSVHSDIEADLLQEIAKTYQNLGAYNKAHDILQEVYEIKLELHPKNNTIKAQSMLLLGENSRLMSNNKKALDWLQQSLSIFSEEPKDNIKHIASVKSKLGRVMVLLGDFSNAEKTLHEATELSKNIYGEQTLEYAQALNDLNSAYFRQGKYKQVQKLLIESKQIRESILAKTNGFILNTDYATNVNNLGLAYYLQGNLVEGEKYFRLANTLRNKIFTKPHPDQAQSLTNLGLLLNDAGKAHDALPYLQKALTVREQTLSKGHMLIIDAKNNLAMVFHENKEFYKADNIYRKILETTIKNRGKKHPQTLSLMSNRANTLLELKSNILAHQLFTQSLQYRQETLPSDHLYLSYSYIGLGRAEIALGNFSVAKDYILKGVKIRQDKLPTNHWLTGESLYALALVNFKLGIINNKKTNTACSILKNTKGENHLLTTKCLNLVSDSQSMSE